MYSVLGWAQLVSLIESWELVQTYLITELDRRYHDRHRDLPETSQAFRHKGWVCDPCLTTRF